MSVSPFPTVVTRAWRGLLLLLCLLAGAGCAARNRPAPTPLPTATVRFLAVPTFTPTPTPIVARPTPVFPPATPTTISVQAEGVYADRAAHHDGSYRLQRHADRVEAIFMTTRSPVQAGTQLPPPVLFTLPPAFRPPVPVLRRVTGQVVRADGSPDSTQPDPRPFRLQLEPDGRVRYLDHPEVADLAYLAYTLHLAWGTTRGANDQAVLAVLQQAVGSDRVNLPSATDESGRVTYLGWETDRGHLYIHRIPEIGVAWELPPELGQLTGLTTLRLGGPQLHGEIPPELGQLPNLRELYLALSHLSGAVPPELGQLTNLVRLELQGNQLTALPPEMGQLTNLGVLELQGNRLTALPPELGQLPHLARLGLRNNQLTALPPELWQLAGLVKLDLSGNPWAAPPPPA